MSTGRMCASSRRALDQREVRPPVRRRQHGDAAELDAAAPGRRRRAADADRRRGADMGRAGGGMPHRSRRRLHHAERAARWATARWPPRPRRCRCRILPR